ncbi:MAG: acyl carrier protein [Aquamicrobium sp.]|uniref:acyl carrier protein n=1 Tax=Aquamicrobium sp. TaxID=1872579 RepID=UPI00349E5172|nr:acyl carrier protein [Aquamicrobium sp.]MCO5155993.1 acyl carrier protein [Aquamicrobium sp.]
MSDELATTILGKIKAHAAPETGAITLDTELSELGIHSLELTEIVFELEDEFDIEIEMNTVDAWANLTNVGDIVDAVRGLVETKA